MRRVMLLAVLALALPTASIASSKDPISINFGVIADPVTGGDASYTGKNLQVSTAFNLGGGPYLVNVIGPSDQSGLVRGGTVALSPSLFSYGSGDSGATSLTKSWTDSLGTFSETFTSFTADRTTANSLALILSGTLSGPGVSSEPITLTLNANQDGGPGNAINWSLTERATGVSPIPEPGTLSLLGTGLIGLAGMARRKLGR